PWRVEIDVVNERQRLLAPTLQAAIVAAFDEVARQGDPRDPQSELQRLSSARHLRPLAASKGAAHLVRTAVDVAAASGGAFVFTRGAGQVRVVDGAIVKDAPGLELDLSPLLPGAAVDAVARLLDERGFTAFRITAGTVTMSSTPQARTARATSSACAVEGSDAVIVAALAPTCATLGIERTTAMLATSFAGYEATTTTTTR
ncbi:MAG TPA: FAD:protein FMN transferase, partial [Myxococcota bacterium]